MCVCVWVCIISSKYKCACVCNFLMTEYKFPGIHAILKNGNKLSYVVYNLSTGRYVQDCYIPSDISSFLGLQPQNINLTSAGEVCYGS